MPGSPSIVRDLPREFYIMFRTMTLVALMSLVVACGGSGDDSSPDVAPDGDTASTTTAPAPETPADEPGDADPATGGDDPEGIQMVPAGNSTVSVDGSALDAQELLRCIPFTDEDDRLDLTVLGDGFQLFINIAESASNELTIQGRAVGDGESTGVFAASAFSMDGESWISDEGEVLDHTSFNWTGDRVSGSMTLFDIQNSGDTIDVEFDVIVPPETQDCSL